MQFKKHMNTEFFYWYVDSSVLLNEQKSWIQAVRDKLSQSLQLLESVYSLWHYTTIDITPEKTRLTSSDVEWQIRSFLLINEVETVCEHLFFFSPIKMVFNALLMTQSSSLLHKPHQEVTWETQSCALYCTNFSKCLPRRKEKY